MKYISGTFNGTGAALNVGIGFLPSEVRIRNIENAEDYYIEWSINMRSAECIEGIRLAGDDAAAISRTPLTKGNGIVIYRGGDIMTSASTSYIVEDPDTDKRDAGTGDTIDTWTLGNATNFTGNWNAECSTTYVGEGSRICVDAGDGGKWSTVTALTSNGEAANEVTLSEPLKSGKIVALTGMYDWLGAANKKVIPAGFTINETTLNVSGELCYFEAWNHEKV